MLLSNDNSMVNAIINIKHIGSITFDQFLSLDCLAQNLLEKAPAKLINRFNML